jgi:hypothetical protein
VIPEDKSLVNVLQICEVNKCGYNCENPINWAIKSKANKLITVAENLTRDIWCQEVVTAFYTRQYLYKFQTFQTLC